MNGFLPVLRSELGKVRATRMTYGLLVTALALVVLSVLAIVLPSRSPDGPSPLEGAGGVRLVLSSADAGMLFVLILGILTITGEFRHGTATWTFLATPRRDRVVAAKLAAASVTGLAYAVACLAVMLAVALPLLATIDAARLPTVAEVVSVSGAALAAYTLYAMLGVAVGALLRNQVAAIVVMLAWSFVVESLVLLLLPTVGRWLPGNASSALTSGGDRQFGIDLLPPWAGGLVLLGYVVVLAVLGSRLVLRRDIT
jgi:hypothetical protein